MISTSRQRPTRRIIRRMPGRSSSRLLTITLFFLGAAGAQAAEIPCGPVNSGGVRVDGLLGDWAGVPGVSFETADLVAKGRGDWDGPQDLSFSVRCNHDKRNAYFAVNVTDEYFVRTPSGKGSDHLLLRLGGRTLALVPGDLKSLRAQVRWGKPGGKRAKGVVMAEAMQQGGYSIEIKLPLKRLPGYRRGVPSVQIGVAVGDSDSKAKQRVQTVIDSGRSRLVFAQASADLEAFLKAKGYRHGQIRFRKNIDVVGDKGVEQVLLVGRTIGIVGNDLPGGGFFYLDINARPRDIAWIKTMDLNGDGKAEIVARHIERASSGYRELVSVYRFDSSNKFVRPFAHEITKGQRSMAISNRISFKRRRRRRKTLGFDIIVDRPRSRGFTQDSYRERPASDCYPILLPWEEKKRRAFRFEGDEFSEL